MRTAEKRPMPTDFLCDDCGRPTRDRHRNVCTRCQAALCDFCRERHWKQHTHDLRSDEYCVVRAPKFKGRLNGVVSTESARSQEEQP